MPKLKTNKSARKRFRFTAKGKVKRKKAYLRHILTTRSKNRKRKLRHAALVSSVDIREVKRLLPYG